MSKVAFRNVETKEGQKTKGGFPPPGDVSKHEA
jgi:hypothetical protein